MDGDSELALCSALRSVRYLVLFQNGRLGNQFFQYFAARSLAPFARVICIGFESLAGALASGVTPSGPTRRGLALEKLFRALGRNKALNIAPPRGRVFSCVSEKFDDSGLSVLFSPGFLANVAILDGFFQCEDIILGASPSEYLLSPKLQRDARSWIYDNLISRGNTPYFLHIRRGDYVKWPSRSFPAVLPFRWYKGRMNEILEADTSAHFLVFTDDIPYVEEWLGSDERVTISKGSELVDFFLMTECSGGGVLSASSFSWWAAWYGMKNFSNARYLAPRYWAERRRNIWYPRGIQVPWIDYVDVY